MPPLNPPWEKRFIEAGQQIGDWISNTPLVGLLDGKYKASDLPGLLAGAVARDAYGYNKNTGSIDSVPGFGWAGVVLPAKRAVEAGLVPARAISDARNAYRAAGATDATVTRETGLWRGPDSILRSEYPDTDWRFNTDTLPKRVNDETNVGLLDAFPGARSFIQDVVPEAKDTRVNLILRDSNARNLGGTFHPKQGIIYEGAKDANFAELGDFEGGILHEIQHVIQTNLGLTTGANSKIATVGTSPRLVELRNKLIQEHPPAKQLYDNAMAAKVSGDRKLAKMFFDEANKEAGLELYKRVIGEVEARNVTNRHYVSQDLLSQLPFVSTMDRPYSIQLPAKGLFAGW